MKIKKISGTAVLQGNVVDSVFGNSTKDAPSQSSINKILTYSTEERLIGIMEYPDGQFKPRYRKTFLLTSSDYIAEQSSFDVSDLNIEYLKFDEISIDYISNSGKSYKRPAFGAAVPGTNVDCFAAFFRDNTIQIRLKQDVNDNIQTLNAIIITLLYTKTTDDFISVGDQ